ncbi:MAG: hypothetical protein ACFHX7_22300 [Pseudomonadota bacterium]
MTMTHEIDGEILIIRQGNVTDPAEILVALGKAFADPALAPGSSLLWDATDAPAQASANKIESLLRSVGAGESPLARRCAMVVATALQHGVSRIFAAYAAEAGVDARVFHDLEEAKNWLRASGTS